jgi:hypothetical protein
VKVEKDTRDAEQAAKDAAQDEAIAEAKSSADEKALSFEVDGLDLVVTYGNGSTERVKLPTGKGVGDMWWGHDPKSVPANVQLYSGQLLSRAAYEAHSALVLGGKRTVVTENEWQAYVAEHGFCPWFSEGDGVTTYRFPLVKGVHPKFVAALAEAGQYIEAGAPEIGGQFGETFFVNSLVENGCFTLISRGSTNVGASSPSPLSRGIFNFSAQKSNHIYGNSDTIQPPALTFLLGEYVVGSVAVVGEADAESLLASVTTLESNVGALENGVGRAKAYITETWVSGTSWYRKWSDGWIEQGGYVERTSSYNDNYTVSLFVEMRDVKYSLKVETAHTSANTSSGSIDYSTVLEQLGRVHSVSTTSFKFQIGTNLMASWKVEGYV